MQILLATYSNYNTQCNYDGFLKIIPEQNICY